MKPITFKEQNVTFAKDQPQYLPLPAYKVPNDINGHLVCYWRLTFLERLQLIFTGKIWHSVLTFNASLQPQSLSVEKPDFAAMNQVGNEPSVV